MKAMIVYDSMFGNTEKVAQAIASALGIQDICMVRLQDGKKEQFVGLDLLIVGSPTQRFRPTPDISSLLKGISKNSLNGVRVAAFDTRLITGEIEKTPILAFFVKLFGSAAYAARHIANSLKKSGGELIAAPEGFYVEGMKGPLVQGELERAAVWLKEFSPETH